MGSGETDQNWKGVVEWGDRQMACFYFLLLCVDIFHTAIWTSKRERHGILLVAGVQLFHVLLRVAKQGQHVFQALLVDARRSLLLHARLGIERDTQPSLVQHPQIVGTITYGNDLLGCHALGLGNDVQELSLADTVDNRTHGLARQGQAIPGDFKLV